MNYWKGKRVLVTGGNGFLGKHLVKSVYRAGASVIVAAGDFQYREVVLENYLAARPDIVIHLAAQIGGIGKNIERPAEMFYGNMLMGIQVIDAIRSLSNVKLVMMGTACEYPANAPLPIAEESLWQGYPAKSNGPYGIAKRALYEMGRAYREQYGLNIIHLLMTNLYGPGDNFGDGSHVIPDMIRKLIDAKQKGLSEITFWGTGTATRDLLYVGEAVDGIMLATEHYNGEDPINIGSGIEHPISEIAHRIALIIGYDGEIKWDTSMPDGQARRVLDVSKAQAFGFDSDLSLQSGLTRTIKWYLEKSL